MTNSDLLKEAIADAKAVKETAIANAKLALEEAFTPRIQSMISSRLEEEGEEEFGDEEEMPVDGEEGMEDAGLDVGDLSIDADQDGEFDEFDIMSKQPIATEVPGEEMPAEEMPAEEPVDEYDLSEILRQLDEEDMEEKEMETEATMDSHEEIDEEFNIDALLEELMSEEEEEKEEEPKSHEDSEKMMKENEALKLELEEAYNAIRTMKDSLNEVNMLNAKLLFTNKLFKAHSLSESQKVKVIDNFDRAKTIREVKLVYATLSESFASKKSLVKESIASKPVASTKPKQTILSEGDQIAARFKKLAGLN